MPWFPLVLGFDRGPSQENILASILEKLERIEEEAARLTALAHVVVALEHRQEFLSSAGIWQDATVIGELVSRAIGSDS
jgi:hypothetical protein